MNERAFIDTNVFIYLYSEDEAQKRDVSQKAVERFDCVISTQVLNEFSNVCIGKLGQPPENVELAINEIAERCAVLIIEKQTIAQALKINKRYGYKYFDCLMIASALSSGCEYFITEDLADGQVIDNKLTIINIYSEKNTVKFLNSETK